MLDKKTIFLQEYVHKYLQKVKVKIASVKFLSTAKKYFKW